MSLTSESKAISALVAQWIEQFRPKEKVVGSTPTQGTILRIKLRMASHYMKAMSTGEINLVVVNS